jgi:ABC-type transport system involved in cytochrome bd biosynthesis fused ATPase/permease subunit
MAPTLSIQDRINLIDTVFTPAAPIRTRDLFFGRMDQLKRVVETINEPGQHAALYGERGVGKTSLANIINDRLQ